ncbi:hypothetical protein [Xanthomonas translucens]|uniref:hypothetical protein n=1 Tax=Xanthomonas campestris pv. translucens TaxID=343 RepID=UPI000AED9D36|nr:hypothetical protein [Xanthomonas translucens]
MSASSSSAGIDDAGARQAPREDGDAAGATSHAAKSASGAGARSQRPKTSRHCSGFSAAYSGDADGKESIRQAFASHASIYDSENDAQTPSPPQFIHLIESRHFSPGGQPLPNNRSVLWRGKINVVSGFSLGSLSAEEV